MAANHLAELDLQLTCCHRFWVLIAWKDEVLKLVLSSPEVADDTAIITGPLSAILTAAFGVAGALSVISSFGINLEPVGGAVQLILNTTRKSCLKRVCERQCWAALGAVRHIQLRHQSGAGEESCCENKRHLRHASRKG